MLRELFDDEVGASEWSSIYLIIIFAIAAVLVIALIKPMFKASQNIVASNPIVQRKEIEFK